MATVMLYTDAGVSTHRSAWAAIAIGPTSRIEDSGVLREHGPKFCTTLAELRAMANGLNKVVRMRVCEPGDHVEIRCDNQAAVELVNKGREAFRKKQWSPSRVGRKEQWLEAAEKLREIAKEGGVTFEALWVKGHSRAIDTAQSQLIHRMNNQKCDRLVGKVFRTHKH